MSRRRVLLIQKDFDVARMYALGLESAGYAVTLVAEAPEALSSLTGDMPDIVIVDWEMPAVLGHELMAALQEGGDADRRVPLIFLCDSRRSDNHIAGAVFGGRTVPWLVKTETTPVALSAQVAEVFGSMARLPDSPVAS